MNHISNFLTTSKNITIKSKTSSLKSKSTFVFLKNQRRQHEFQVFLGADIFFFIKNFTSLCTIVWYFFSRKKPTSLSMARRARTLLYVSPRWLKWFWIPTAGLCAALKHSLSENGFRPDILFGLAPLRHGGQFHFSFAKLRYHRGV